jgi:hypothetical protein
VIVATLNIPFSSQGLLLDPNIPEQISSIASQTDSITDVVICIYGWYENDESGMVLYNKWSSNIVSKFSPNSKVLQLNIYWPSVVSQDNNSIVNLTQPFSWWHDCKAADQIGYYGLAPLLQQIIDQQKINADKLAIRYTYIAHSLGNRIACSAMENLDTLIPSNLVMLQAAVNYNAFQTDQEYSSLGSEITYTTNSKFYKPIRIFNTKSGLDLALNKIYIDAQCVVPNHPPAIPAIGSYGIDPEYFKAMSGQIITIDVGYSPPDLSLNQLIVADLTPLHTNDGVPGGPIAGKHNDINRPEISSAILAFLLRDI